MTELNYLNNTYLFESEAKIIEVGENEYGKYLVLDKTIFYPQGGGQPTDTGEIFFGENIFQVKNVRLNDNGIVFHYGDSNYNFIKNSKVKLEINKKERIKNAKNHTAGHLLDIAVKNIGLNLKAIKGFHFDSGCYVEYSGIYDTEQKEDIIKKLNLEINNLISKKLEIFLENNSNGDAPLGKSFRKIYFKNYKNDGCGCGGTHLNSTLELGKIIITNIKNKKGNCKISYEVI